MSNDPGSFPVAALPEPVRSYVLSAAASLRCDAGVAAVLALSAVAGAVGGTRGVRRTADGACEPAVLWGLVVSPEPATSDAPAPDLTPALNRVLDVLYRQQQQLADAHRRSVALYRPAMREWLRKLRRLEQLKKDNPAYRPLRSEIPMGEPSRPILARLIGADPSCHALATAMAESGRGTLLARGALDGWVAGLVRSAAAGDDPDWDRWRACHDGAPSFDLPAASDDDRSLPVAVEYPALSVIGGATLAAIRPCSAPTSTDPLDFFLPVLSPSEARPPVGPADPEAVQRFEEVLYRLMDLKRLSVDPVEGDLFDFGPVPVPLDADAQAAWATLLPDLSRTRADRHALRLAALLALVRDAAHAEARGATDHDAAGDEIDDDDDETEFDDEGPAPEVHVPTITAADLDAAVELARWFAGERDRVRGASSRSARDRRRSDLLDHVRALGGSATVRSLMRAGPCFPTAVAARDALDDLARDGHGAWSDPGPRAQPVFRLTPAAGSAP